MQVETAALSFRQGSADKVYNAILKEAGDGWVVNFAYGRRGKALKHGTKTANPTTYEKAKKAFDSLVKSKVSKGYTCDNESTFVAAGGAQMAQDRTEFLPQLLNPIEEEDLTATFQRFHRYVAMQTKHDGERRGILYKNDELYGANRRGLRVPLNPLTQEALERVIEYTGIQSLVLDAEDMGEHVVIFDVLEWDNEELYDRSFQTRADFLWHLEQQMLEAGVGGLVVIDLPRYYDNIIGVRCFIEDRRERNEEGVVIRDPLGTYTAGRPNSGGPCIKLKFYATATCRVASVHDTKRSIGLELADENGMFDSVGNCTIPPNYEIPNVGNLVEIKYLYAYRNGSIYQPQYKGVRTDLTDEAAVTRQLKYKD